MSLQSDSKSVKVFSVEQVELSYKRDYNFTPEHMSDLCLSHERLRAERYKLSLLIQAAVHLLKASHGPKHGPTNYEETKQRIFDEAAKLL